MASCKSVLAVGLRSANFILAAVGGTMMGYGGYLAVTYKQSDPLWTGIIALGAIHFGFAVTVLFCAWKSLFALRLYGTVVGLLALAEASITLLYWVRRPAGGDDRAGWAGLALPGWPRGLVARTLAWGS